MIRVFIGFDQVEAVAYHVLCHSILSRASVPVSFTPIKRTMLRGIHSRPIDEKQSNEFSFTRFLVPYLSGYSGHAIFMDCDMLCRADIAELLEAESVLWSPVSVVKHDYVPKDETKYLGATQYPYQRKNWSSVMVFNCAFSECRRLTPEYVNAASGLDLHQFKWAQEERIGSLPKEWNHLVSEYAPNPNAKLIHYTVGGPWFDEYRHCEYSAEWFDEYAQMRHVQGPNNYV